MDEALLMKVIDRWENLKHDLSSIIFWEFGSLNDLIEQFSSLEQIHDKIKIDVIFIYFIEFHNGLVVHLLQNIHFPLESLNTFRVVNRFLFNELYSSLKSRNFTDTFVNFSIRALSKLLFDLIMVGELSRLLLDEAQLRYL